MPDIVHATQGYVVLLNPIFTGGAEGAAGSTLNWNNLDDFNGNRDVHDVDGDGILNVGVDYWDFSGINGNFFSGYTVTGTDLVEYPVYYNGSAYIVPLPVDGDVQSQIPLSGASNVYQASVSGTYMCFAAGSMIATPDGETAVEALVIGDMLRTADGRDVAIKWVGRQTLQKLIAGRKMQPVRICAGALGNDLPHCDLTVTADHGMILEGLVINASALVNGDTIDFVPLADLPTAYTVYHIETDAHDIILANGAPSETFMDAAGRAAFDNHQEYLDRYGAERIIPEMPRPRINAQRLLPDTIKTRLGVSDLKIVTLSA